MMFTPWGGFGPLGHILTTVIAGFWFIAVFVVTVGLLFLLVRFLLVGTRAAQIYVARNAPVVPPASASTTPATSPATSPAAPAEAATSSVVPPTTTSTSTVTKPISTKPTSAPGATPGTKSATRGPAKPRTPKD